jgi:hypothetical protein
LWGSAHPKTFSRGSRFDRRFYAIGALVLVAGIAVKPLGGDDFHTYPTVQLVAGPSTLVLAAVVGLSGLAPWRRRPRRRTAAGRAGVATRV